MFGSCSQGLLPPAEVLPHGAEVGSVEMTPERLWHRPALVTLQHLFLAALILLLSSGLAH